MSLPLGLALAAATATSAVDLLYMGPRCLSQGDVSINVMTVLFQHFERHPGRIDVVASGLSVLRRGDTILVPEGDAYDAERAGRMLAALARGEVERERLEAKVPVLDSPWETVVLYPAAGHFDWIALTRAQRLESVLADAEARTADVSRWVARDGTRMLAFDLSGGTESSTSADILDWDREFIAVSRIRTPDDDATLYSVGKGIARGGRIKAELDRLDPAGRGVLLHPGDLLDPSLDPEERAACGPMFATLGPAAIVPREAELAIGAGLAAEAGTLPYVAANLFDAKSGERPFPRFRLVERAGRTIAIVGIVDPEQLEALPAAARAAWRLTDPVLELATTREAITAQLGRRPDLLVALRSGATPFSQSLSHYDVVLGEFVGRDLIAKKETIDIDALRGGREGARYPAPFLHVFGNRSSVGRIRAHFTPRLARIEHEVRPVLAEGPRDPEIHRQIRAREEREALRDAKLVLPDVAPFAERMPELHSLIWGDRVPHRGRFRLYERRMPARYSDPLWTRVLLHAALDALEADVAISRAPQRGFDMIGPLSRMFLEDWLKSPDSLRVAEVPGAALLAIAAFAGEQRSRIDSSHDFLYFGAFDPAKGVVRGRRIDPEARYRVALTDYVAGLEPVAKALRGVAFSDRFRREGERWVEDADGAPLALTAPARATFDGWLDPARGTFDPAFEPALEALLAGREGVVVGRWSFRVRSLSLSASRYANSENVGRFASTRETRVTTPDNYALGGRANLDLLYDGPSIGWEIGARAELSRFVIALPNMELVQEQADDLVAHTELRLNATQLALAGEDVPIVPFARLSFDSELTATPRSPTEAFPHQKITRGALGLVAQPGPRLREVRIGALAQLDLSEAPAHSDFGVTAGYGFAWPLFGPVSWHSELDLRLLAPDGDDRDSDLGLYLSAVNKLLVPILGRLSLSLFADLVVVRGKTANTDEVGGSWIFGAGLDFSRTWRL